MTTEAHTRRLLSIIGATAAAYALLPPVGEPNTPERAAFLAAYRKRNVARAHIAPARRAFKGVVTRRQAAKLGAAAIREQVAR